MLSIKKLKLVLYTCFISLSINSQNNAIHVAEISSKLDSQFLSYENQPGIAIAILENDSIVLEKYYGLANLEHNTPITEQTTFHVASVSKQFTAFAILLLESEGKLSLDDNIKTYLPELKLKTSNITIRHLLSHTSGIKDQWNLLRLAGWSLDDIITNNSTLDLIYNQKYLNFHPNDAYLYSNSGYTLLAEIIARVSNMSFSDYTTKYIFEPLKMVNSKFIDTPGTVVKHKATSYFKKNNTYVINPFNNYSVGATNLSTTIKDLSKWSSNFNQKIVGSDAIFEAMNTLNVLNNGKTHGYGLGQFISTHKGITKIDHSGSDASYQAYLGRFPDQNISIIAFSNNGSIHGGRAVYQLIDLCLNSYYKPNPKTIQKERKAPINLSSSHLKQFEGFYWNDNERYSRQIKVENNTLMYLRTNGSKTALIPVEKNSFEMEIDEYLGIQFKDNKMVLSFDNDETVTLEKYKPSNYDYKSLKQFEGVYYNEELNVYYSINTKEDSLIINHNKLGNFKLNAIKSDYFTGNKGSIRKVEFIRGTNNNIIKLKISSSRAKNIVFKKIN